MIGRTELNLTQYALEEAYEDLTVRTEHSLTSTLITVCSVPH